MFLTDGGDKMAGVSSPRSDWPASTPVGSDTASDRGTGLRRRGETLEVAIVGAVLALLREGGYEAVTMEGVAARARTGKAALYRRWESRAHLVADVVARCLPQMGGVPDHGNIRDDLLDVMRRLATFVNSPTGCVVSTITSNRGTDTAFRNLVATRIVEPQLRIVDEVLKRGIDRGEVRRGVRVDLLADVGPALLLKRYLADHLPVADDYIVSVVDDLLMPIIR